MVDWVTVSLRPDRKLEEASLVAEMKELSLTIAIAV
jgi:hypothetical protein